jgi:hypothetical protein
VTDEQRKIAEEQLREVGPVPQELEISQEDFQAMSWPEQCDHLEKLAMESSRRYGGRPELMMLEHPQHDLEAMAAKLKSEGWPPKAR